ncbi:hypothetical protein [Streptomyces sp. ITFR-6]|uniref:hypothetical protein n=1 Tax=Streptomyces sp. ITFR-6 TaxID=3075197 RepID=UPI00288A9938|nr:hypothetical protein [Streptomyces sp. ITFR-6]WNI30998.1 hypothetical protein RLT59_21075 [Streptomyces sp. ITFR-6]
MRRIVLRPSPGRPLFRYYLHWSDGADLASRDSRVAAGTSTEADFAGAVIGEPYNTSHPACGARFRVIELASAILLFSDDLERSRAHSYRNEYLGCVGDVLRTGQLMRLHEASSHSRGERLPTHSPTHEWDKRMRMKKPQVTASESWG